jgi:hypothetical protein
MSATPPILDIDIMEAGEAKVFTLYQGINLTIIPAAGASATYSYVNNEQATAHDTQTQQTISAKYTIPCEWPYVLVTTSGGQVRVGLV